MSTTNTNVSGGAILGDFPEHAKLIGILITDWNTIEQLLITILAFGMGTKALMIHPMIYSLRNSSARIDVMEQAFKYIIKEKGWDANSMALIIKEARKVCGTRNKYAHSVYGKSGEKLMSMDFSAGLSEMVSSNVDTKVLSEAVKRSQALSTETQKFMTTILFGATPPGEPQQ